MPWKQRKPLDEKKNFIHEWKQQEVSLAELCRCYEISRQTGYKWIERYEEEGLDGLQDQSRAPHHRAREIGEGVKELILAVKAKHGFWGARKIVAHLEAQSGKQDWPAVSSVGPQSQP